MGFVAVCCVYDCRGYDSGVGRVNKKPPLFVIVRFMYGQIQPLRWPSKDTKFTYTNKTNLRKFIVYFLKQNVWTENLEKMQTVDKSKRPEINRGVPLA